MVLMMIAKSKLEGLERDLLQAHKEGVGFPILEDLWTKEDFWEEVFWITVEMTTP